jgi:hypothetical protein
MRGGSIRPLFRRLRAKNDWPRPVWVRSGTLSEPRPQTITRPREATGEHLPSLYLIALGFGRRTRQGAGRAATHPRAG